MMTVAFLFSTIFFLAVLIIASHANYFTSSVPEPAESKFYSSNLFFGSNLGSQFNRPNQYITGSYNGFNREPAFVPQGYRQNAFAAYNSGIGFSSGANGNFLNSQNNFHRDQTYFGTPLPTFNNFGNGFNSLPQANQFSDPFRRTPFPSRFPLTNSVASSPSIPVFQTVNQGNDQQRPIQGIFGPGKPGQSQSSTSSNSQNAQSTESTGTGNQFRPIQGVFGPGKPGQFEPQSPGLQRRPIKGIFGPGLPGQFVN